MTSAGSGRIAFLVGAPRSGTNWLQRMLAAHPDVAAAPSETMLFTNAVQPVVDAVHHGAITSPRVGAMFCDRTELIDALRTLTDRLYGSLRHGLGDPALLLERSPLHAFDVTLIREVYPEAPVIHLVRDGRDVAASLREQSWGPTTMAEAARLWRTSVESARALAGDPLFREVRYETLLADPWSGVAALLDWLALPVDERVQAAVRAEAAAAFNVTGPGITAAKWQDRLSAEDRAAFDAEAGELLAGLDDPVRVPTSEPTLVERTTRRARRIATDPIRLLRPARPDAHDPTHPGHALVEAFLEAIHLGRPGRLAELVAPDAPVRVVTDRTDRSGRGKALLDHLADVAAPLATSTQDRGDVHSGLSSTTVVACYSRPGVTTRVVAVFEVAMREARAITRIAWYQHDDPERVEP